MKNRTFYFTCFLLAGCASQPSLREGEPAPYRAVVAFDWGVQNNTEGAQGASLPFSQEQVAEEILQALEEHQVFSDFFYADLDRMHELARKLDVDLVVLVRIGALGQWKEGTTRTVPGLAVLDGVLWASTGIGAWWVADIEYPTKSDVEVSWKRPEATPSGPPTSGSPEPQDDQGEFTRSERLSSGDYRLSLWDRAKPWRQPLAYLVNVALPPVLVPFEDPRDVERSLASSALEDIKRELVRKLKGGYLGSAGSPFLFLLEEPRNGAAVEGNAVKLQYRYRVESGFQEHETTRLSALSIDILRGGKPTPEKRREYSGEKLRSINDKIGRKEAIEEVVQGLEPGLNLIRFAAQTELGGLWITNTVAIVRR